MSWVMWTVGSSWERDLRVLGHSPVCTVHAGSPYLLTIVALGGMLPQPRLCSRCILGPEALGVWGGEKEWKSPITTHPRCSLE